MSKARTELKKPPKATVRKTDVQPFPPVLPPAPIFVPVDVIVMINAKPYQGPNTTSDGRFTVVCHPPAVKSPPGDSVINYRLVSPTPPGIVFLGIDKSRPYALNQLSTPSISADGKMMTLSNRNTVEEVILVMLRFRDDTISIYDPEVTNNDTQPH
ncbi:MAG: hypothetical protein HY254_24885 [Burkholderiales bacterium]|nr:hypothetical protein [Burkholderiales bacterium]